MSADAITAVLLACYGVFVVVWCGGDFAHALRNHEARGAAGEMIAESANPKLYRSTARTEGLIALWGLMWAIAGALELVRPNSLF